MRSCVTSCKAREVSVVLALVSRLSITFPAWFRVAVVERDMHVPATRTWALSKRSPQVRLASLNQHSRRAPVWLVRIDSGRGRPGPQKIIWSSLGVLPGATTNGGAPPTEPQLPTRQHVAWPRRVHREQRKSRPEFGESNVWPRKLGVVFHLVPDFSAGKVPPAGRAFVRSGQGHHTRRNTRHLRRRPGAAAWRRCGFSILR